MMMKFVLISLLSMLLGGPVGFNETVHDFGTITMKDGPQSVTFTLKNDSTEPVTIFAAVSSCGCTGVEWTREAIAPGKTGIVKATYSNDEGPYPFDKSIRVYTSVQDKPFTLHLKGVVKKNGSK